MTLILPRRRFLIGLGALFAAPAIVRVENIMPVRSIERLLGGYWLELLDAQGYVKQVALTRDGFHLRGTLAQPMFCIQQTVCVGNKRIWAWRSAYNLTDTIDVDFSQGAARGLLA